MMEKGFMLLLERSLFLIVSHIALRIRVEVEVDVLIETARNRDSFQRVESSSFTSHRYINYTSSTTAAMSDRI